VPVHSLPAVTVLQLCCIRIGQLQSRSRRQRDELDRSVRFASRVRCDKGGDDCDMLLACVAVATVVMCATPTTRPSLEQSVSVFLARHNSMPQPTLPNPSHFLTKVSTLVSRSHVGAPYCGTTFIPLQVTAEAPCNVSVGVCTEDGGKTWACNATALINGTVLDKVSDSSMRPKLPWHLVDGVCMRVCVCVCARACAVPNVHVRYVRVWWSFTSIAASIVAPEGEGLDACARARCCSCPAVHVPSCRECSMHARHRSSHRSHRPLIPAPSPSSGDSLQSVGFGTTFSNQTVAFYDVLYVLSNHRHHLQTAT
jgi:hypothetical protein